MNEVRALFAARDSAAAAVIGLALLNAAISPTKAALYLSVAVGFIAIRMVIGVIGARKRAAGRNEVARRLFAFLFMASAVIAAALSISLADQWKMIDPDGAKRAFGAVLGFVLLACGNALPKLVVPVTEQPCDPARKLAAERFVGASFVVAGAASIAVWAFRPVAEAEIVSILIGLGAFAVAIGTGLWLHTLSPKREIE